MELDMNSIYSLVQTLVLAVLPVLAWKLLNLLSADQKRWLQGIVETAVYAAEQMYGDGFGKEKKEYAISVVQAWLDAKGIKLNASVIEAEIEAAVMKHFPKFIDVDDLELVEDE